MSQVSQSALQSETNSNQQGMKEVWDPGLYSKASELSLIAAMLKVLMQHSHWLCPLMLNLGNSALCLSSMYGEHE